MHIGNRDNPIGNLGRDRLSRETQVGGFADFVLNCETPMTISIQGSWGTGKTSFVNLVMEQLRAGEHKNDIIFVPFNSWQFVQFDMSDQLSSNLIVAITKELEKTIPSEEARKPLREVINGMELLKAGGRLTAKAANNFIKNKFDVDVQETVKETLEDAGLTDPSRIFKQTKEVETAIDTITSLKKNLQNAILASLGITEEMRKAANAADILKYKRIIFFVDDLDRLTPDKAVEVMEILKMFLDCEHCVFLLAIDYDAVVSGVSLKYHNAISEEKGRDFFEKMIQVVYTLPDTMNQTDKYISDILINNNQNISLAYDFADLVKKGGKDNPRAIKRLLNSYFLLDMMKRKCYGENQKQAESVLQFAVLCLQAICPQMYDYLSDQFSGIYNYEKSVIWFNALHKYVYEMSHLASSTIEIKEEKLEQWHLLRPDKKPNREKLEFLCTFFDKMDGSLFAKKAPGKQLVIQDILNLQKSIMWTNLVQGRDDAHTYLDNIARIKVVYGGYQDVYEETTLGTIEEAYKRTVYHILKLMGQNGMFNDTIFDSTPALYPYQKELFTLSHQDLLTHLIEKFHYFLSPKQKEGWERMVVCGREIFIKTDFRDIVPDMRLDVMIGITQILSKYTRVSFAWYKDRRGKEVLAEGYDSQEGKVYAPEVCFLTINGSTTQIQKRNTEKAYVVTILELLSSVDSEKYHECLAHFPQFLKMDGFEEDELDMENDTEPLDQSTLDDLFGFDFDFDENADFGESEDDVDDAEEEEELEDIWSVPENTSPKPQVNMPQPKQDDLDSISPVEYQDEHDRRFLEYVAEEGEDGWIEGDEAVDGWRYEPMFLEGSQVDISVFVGDGTNIAMMTENVYRLSNFLGIDFIWYEDAYMRKVNHRGLIPENHVFDYLKENSMKDVFKSCPELFEVTPRQFLSGFFD